MRWRIGLLVFGILFGCIAFWQQARAADSSSEELRKASEQTAANVEESDKQIIDEQSIKIGRLQASLDKQGLLVSAIGKSDFVTGQKPVKVQVTNPSGEQSRTSGPITYITDSITSDRKDFAYEIKVIVQVTRTFSPFTIVTDFDAPLGIATGMPWCNVQTGGVSSLNNSVTNGWKRSTNTISSPAVSPATPVVCYFYSNQQFNVVNMQVVQ